MDDFNLELAKRDAEESATAHFRDYIDATHPTVTIMGIDYDPSRLFENADPVAFRCEFVNFVDEWCEECRANLPNEGPHADWCPEFVAEPEDEE